MLEFLLAASGMWATTFGWGETMCGDVGRAVACTDGGSTSSGLPLGQLPIVAIAAPAKTLIKPRWFKARVDNGVCVWLLLADKKHVRFKESKPWDVSKEALRSLLTGLRVKPSPTWGAKLYLCDMHSWAF